MSFISIEFPLFFALVIAGLAAMPTRDARHAFLLVANLVFYASGTPWFVIVLLVPAIVDYACAIRMEDAAEPVARRRWLQLSLLVNLGVLFYFKYTNFFVDQLAALFGITPGPLALALPVGISFFTFKTMSYTIDVYRGSLRACRSMRDYTMFVSFFPELVAGPIVRASVFLPQMHRALKISWQRIAGAAPLILLGLTKKVFIADRLAIFVDPVFRDPEIFSGATVATAVVAYSIQIYCDFSGYSDIAIGVAKIIGFDLPENFNMPYVARSVTEFWRRWHITLSAWLRDYLYIPLGGNRRGALRGYVNLLATMLLGGLWHGASWTFVIWGFLHGVALIVHKLWARVRPMSVSSSVVPVNASSSVVPATLSWAATYVFVCFGWIFFRAESLGDAGIIIGKITGVLDGGVSWFYLPFWLLLPLVIAAHAAGMLREVAAARLRAIRMQWKRRVDDTPLLPAYGVQSFAAALGFTIWIAVLFLFSPVARSPFIYFSF